MVQKSIIETVTLRVADIARSRQFYEEVVGLQTLTSQGEQVRMGVGDKELLVLLESPDALRRAKDEAGLFHIAFRVPDQAALGDALRRVQRHHRLTGASNHKISHALYLDDPEGNGLEIYYDRPRDEWPIDARGRLRLATQRLDLERLLETAPSEQPGQFPEGTDVGHIHLEVVDLDQAHRFGTELLGLDVMVHEPSVSFVSANDYHHHIGLNRWNRRRRPRNTSSLGLVSVRLALPDQDGDTLLTKARTMSIDIHRHNGEVQLEAANNLRWVLRA